MAMMSLFLLGETTKLGKTLPCRFCVVGPNATAVLAAPHGITSVLARRGRGADR